MDLEERGLRAAANRLFNRYLAPEPPEALTGLIALPLFLSLRAAIRAKVEAASAERLEGEKRDETRALARRYFDCAVRFLATVPPRLVAVGGLSGVGKSALARALAPEIGRAPGALWLRSDVERKAMFGIEETVRLPASAYASDVTRDVYERLIVKARTALRAGQSVLLDATFAAAAERSAAAEVGGGSRRRLCWDFFSTRLWRRALSASARGAPTLPTPTPMWRAGRRRSLWARKDGRRWRLREA